VSCAISWGDNFAAETRNEFNRRVADYLKLRREAVAGLPAVRKNAQPEDIRASKLAQADAIRKARTGAKQGDIFTSGFQQYVREVIGIATRGEGGKPAKKTAMVGNPAHEHESPAQPVELKVNAQYPGSAPLSSVPPSLLLALPELPKELDYRFVGRNLILHDVNAGLIVDYIQDAIPE
jgi:hypothetical protein